ncbi:hypothetical protein DTO271G3_3302 [Paecilomyces variotii]|nr:hypothetical protein DTO271G3_3302 [Paecilomyces variotii]
MSTTSAQINASVKNIFDSSLYSIDFLPRSDSDLQFGFSSDPSEQLDCSGLAQGLWDDSYLETQQQQLSQPSLSSSFSFDQFCVLDSQDTSSIPTPLDQFLASATTSVPHSEAGEVSLTGLVSSTEIFPQDLAESQSFSEFPGQFDSFCSPSEDLLSLVREDSHEGHLVQTEEHQDLMSGTILQQPTFNPRAERLSPSRPSPSCLSLPTFQLGNRLSADRDHASSLTSSRADHYQTSASEAQPTSPCYSSSNSASNRETVLESSRRGKRSFDESTLPSTKSAENSEEDKIVEKRRRNTLAARRFRQKQQDRVTNLEAELAIITKERDELKMLVARYQGETEALRKLVADGKKT